MDKEITIVLDKCHEQLMQWSEDYMYEGMIVSVLGEGLPSYPAEPNCLVSENHFG